MKQHLFTSERLSFRNWNESDISKMAAINADPKVMEFFPSIHNREQTEHFIQRMQKQFSRNGFCYFAVDRLDNAEFIGFIGIAEQHFEADFTPCIDIGWRIAHKEWNKGYATEGAKRCIEFAFEEAGLTTIKAICPVVNVNSEKVMRKLGMHKVKEFDHPLLSEFKELERCVLYEIEKG